MPDLAQGNFANVILSPGDSVRVSTSGQATVSAEYGAPAGTTTINANTQLFGPYGVPAKLRVTAVSGAANYASPTLVPATVDPSTGQLSPPVSGAGKYRVVVIGDSWGQRFYSSSSTGANFLDDGTMAWVQVLTQHRLTPVLPPPATGGTRSSDWLTLIDSALAQADAPCWFVSFLGINDIGVDVDVVNVTLPNLTAIYDKVLSRGHKLIVCNVGPYGPTYVPSGANLATKTAQRALLNQGIAAYVASRNGNCYLADIFGALVDPTNVNGYALAADMDTNGTTGLHTSASGARKTAAPIAAIINANVVDPGVHVTSYTDSFDYDAASKNRVSNPLMLGTGGTTNQGAGTTITATTIAASWQVVTAAGGTCTTVCTTEARTVANDGDAFGQNQVLTITGAGSSDQVTLRTAGNINTRFATGDRVFGEIYVRASSMVNVKSIRCWLNITVGGTAYSRVAMAFQVTGASFSQTDGQWVLRTPEFEFPAGSITAFIMQTEVYFGGAGGAVVRAGRAQIRKVN